jgi:hypothetical protein
MWKVHEAGRKSAETTRKSSGQMKIIVMCYMYKMSAFNKYTITRIKTTSQL